MEYSGSWLVIGFGRVLPRKAGILLPEVIEHGIGRRMTVVGAAVHLAAGDHINSRDLLIQDSGLLDAKLRVGHRAHAKLPDSNQPIERLKPIGHAVGPNHRRCKLRVSYHSITGMVRPGRRRGGSGERNCSRVAADLCSRTLTLGCRSGIIDAAGVDRNQYPLAR